MPGSRPLVQLAPLFVDVANPVAHAPPSKMGPPWYAATIVEPFAKVSGSTWVWWLVVLDALHVACVNGSELTSRTAASPAGARASAAVSAAAGISKHPRDNERGDRG